MQIGFSIRKCLHFICFHLYFHLKSVMYCMSGPGSVKYLSQMFILVQSPSYNFDFITNLCTVVVEWFVLDMFICVKSILCL